MSDYLVELGAKPAARKIIGRLGLPIPMPQKLARSKKPLEERPLDDLRVCVGQVRQGSLSSAIAGALASAGAVACIPGDGELFNLYRERGEAWGRIPVKPDEGKAGDPGPYALVFDASELNDPEGLKAVYEFCHSHIKSLRRCGRVVVVGRPSGEISGSGAAAAARGIIGFIKSLAKETGKSGSTANAILVDTGAEDRLEPALRFVLSERSAFITGQPFHVSARVAGGSASSWLRPLDGRSALVTGSARGIGAAIARAFSREGAKVIIMDRPGEEGPMSALAAETGGVMLPCDLTAPDAPGKVTELIKGRFGGIDVIVHNAGITRDKTLGNMDGKRWDAVIDVNLAGLMRLNEALLPLLRDNGRVVCLSSVGGIAGNFGQTNYAASKAGVIGYVQAIAPALAARGVSVNALAPGFIETQMTAAIPFATREGARRLCALAQGGLPEDVAEAALFLAGPGARSMTGEVLRVCGGNFIGA